MRNGNRPDVGPVANDVVAWTRRRVLEREIERAETRPLLDDDPVQLYQEGVARTNLIVDLHERSRQARLETERVELRQRASALQPRLMEINERLRALGYSQPGTMTPQDNVPSYDEGERG